VVREDEQIADALVISFAVIMGNEFSHGNPQRPLSEQNHALQAGLLNAADEALGVTVQVR